MEYLIVILKNTKVLANTLKPYESRVSPDISVSGIFLTVDTCTLL